MIYERIFAGARSVEQVREAIARAVHELRVALEKEDNAGVTMAHIRSLDDIDPAALARAYTLAERSCVYWPSPGEIRELAGWAETRGAGEALEWALQYLEDHGVEGRPRGGGVTFRDDGGGRRVTAETAPVLQAPELPQEILWTIERMGGGSVKHGLNSLAQHPRVKGWEEAHSEAPSKTAERIERHWMRCYRQRSRVEEPSQPVSRRTA